uniref:Nup96 domain-containing protein n=1 Tax=Elaeophora elaphi TaxID=1147741 RepID=A0A0R3S4A0_9BILA
MSVPENTYASVPIHLENLWEIFRKDPFSDRSIDFARLIAAYYLGFPLLAPGIPGSLPSLYEWPKSLSDTNSNETALLKRVDIAKTISTICDERTPPMLLWICGHHIEAIYYCDQFRDLKSQAMLRFLEEQLSGTYLSLVNFLEEKITLSYYVRLKLLQMFCEGRIEMAFDELDSLGEVVEFGSVQNMLSSWSKLADSLLQMDAIAETQAVKLLLDRILSKMCSVHAMMPLFVNTDISLPRPPVYMCAAVLGCGQEQYCYVRLWILIQAYVRLLSNANVLLICIEHFCWNFLEINGECENQMKQAIVKYYNLLSGREENDDNGLLVKWMREADQSDFEQLNHFFDYLSTFRSLFAHMSEFCPENITCWRNHLLKEVILQEGVNRNEIQQDLQINAVRTKVPDGILIRAEYIARCWSYPTYAADEELLAMNLKLCPSDFVSGTTSSATPSSLKRMSGIEFVPSICHHSSLDIRPYTQCPLTITSRSLPAAVKCHSKCKNRSDIKRKDSWRKLDRAMQEVNVMIDEVEEELRSTSSYVKALLDARSEAFAENATNNSGSDKMSSSNFSSSSSRKFEASSVIEQCKFVNDDRYSLDSTREPECHSDIEKLNFDLLSPQPSIRNVAVVNTTVASAPNASLPSPVIPDSQHLVNNPPSLPVWLKLLPVKQKNFLLSLTPTINQIKEMREDGSVPEIQQPQMNKEAMGEKKQLLTSNLKFELVTTIASIQRCD